MKTYKIYVRDLDKGVLTDVNPAGELLWKAGLYSGYRPMTGSGLRLINSQKMFKFITPSFIAHPIVPLYVAWFFYMFRFYLMPYLLGYSVMGMLSFPLESEIAIQIYQIFGKN